MKDSHFFKQDNGNATSLAFRDFGTKLYEQSLYIAPLDVSACGPSKDQFEGTLMLPLHGDMVPLTGTDVRRTVLKPANVRANRLAEAGGERLARDSGGAAARQPCAACRSGSG